MATTPVRKRQKDRRCRHEGSAPEGRGHRSQPARWQRRAGVRACRRLPRPRIRTHKITWYLESFALRLIVFSSAGNTLRVGRLPIATERFVSFGRTAPSSLSGVTRQSRATNACVSRLGCPGQGPDMTQMPCEFMGPGPEHPALTCWDPVLTCWDSWGPPPLGGVSK